MPVPRGGGAVEVLAVGFWAVWLVCAVVNAAVLGALVTRSAGAVPDGAGSVRPRTGRARDLPAPAVDNWLARGYLAVVAASPGFFLWAAYLSPDPGFAGIWPLMATAPFSILALLVTTPMEWASSLAWLSPLLFCAGAALAGLFNAVLLGRLAHRPRAREARPAV
ncbi:hypothetical protein QQM39_31550 [Streptomyces sp. DT2A-34]|uniref:SCO4225 family membrane protein n=1 Tax=Streptomyces sp. DT2A-34 TaxID=3051182 RepID=UPI00265B9E3B|nr:hypothetical protein [Streptomyces sp. DT2A-34]MDO0915191.1 hypothetical protein [Streptomyces sp. DT2A-34]